MKKAYDIDTVAACEAGAEIEMTHPVTGAGNGVFIKVVGVDSKRWQGILARSNDAERQRHHQAEKRGKKAEPKTQEQITAEGIAMLAEGVLGWRYETIEGDGAERKVVNHPGVIPFEGGELAFSEANAVKLFTARPQDKKAVDEGIADLANFIKD